MSSWAVVEYTSEDYIMYEVLMSSSSVVLVAAYVCVIIVCMWAGGQLIVTCHRRNDDDVTVTSPCLMVDYITDVIRPCPLDLMTFDYLRVTSDNKYIVGVASRGRRLAVFKVSQQGNLRHFLQPTAATMMRSTNAHFTYNNNSHISIAPYLFTYLVCISAQTTILITSPGQSLC